MSFGKRKRLSDSWTEEEVASQFPASAFSFERTLAKHEAITETVEQRLSEVSRICSHLPCRILENWYLVAKPDRAKLGYFASDKTFSFPFRRSPLPVDTQDLQNYVLVGILKPQQPTRKGLKLELDNLDFYTIDHSRAYRGYWVTTSEAMYWLRSPCSKTITIQKLRLRLGVYEFPSMEDDLSDGVDDSGSGTLIAQLPSQERLHCFHRAQLGLLSNLHDIIILPDGSYNSFFHELSLTQMDEVLTPSMIDVAHVQRTLENEQGGDGVPNLFMHGFHLELLQDSKFLLPHIRAFDTQVAASRWYNEWMRMNCIEEPVGFLQTEASEQRWVKLSIDAEARSRQLPCGAIDPKKWNKSTDLLEPIELELQFCNTKKLQTILWENDDILDDDVLPKTPLLPLPRIEEMDSVAPQIPSVGINIISEQSSQAESRMDEVDISIVGRHLKAGEMVTSNPEVTCRVELLPTLPKKRSLLQEQATIVEPLNPVIGSMPRNDLGNLLEPVQSPIFSQPIGPNDVVGTDTTVKDAQGPPDEPVKTRSDLNASTARAPPPGMAQAT